MAIELDKPLPPSLLAAEVLGSGGGAVSIGELVSRGPTLLLFLRHFGCPGCNLQVGTLTPRLLQLHELGVSTVLVSSGGASTVEEFVARRNLGDKKVAVYTDPTLASYRAAGLERSTLGTFGFSALRGFFRATGSGYASARMRGDLRQQGGALLTDGAGTVRFFHRNRHLGDHADLGDIVALAMRMHIEGGARPTGSV